MALYQYIPPSSCHPPGVLTGLIFGKILQIYQFCSLSNNINKELSLFYWRLLIRGYKPDNLLPLLKKSINNVITYLSLSPGQREAKKNAKIGRLDQRIFLHLPYHPQNPLSSFVQHLWGELVFSLPGKKRAHQAD